MNQLYPIVRRKRRPLVVDDVAPSVPAPVPPAVTTPLIEPVLADGRQPATAQPTTSDAKTIVRHESE